MSSGGLQQPSGSGMGHAMPDLRKQLDNTIVETGRFLETVGRSSYPRDITLFTLPTAVLMAVVCVSNTV